MAAVSLTLGFGHNQTINITATELTAAASAIPTLPNQKQNADSQPSVRPKSFRIFSMFSGWPKYCVTKWRLKNSAGTVVAMDQTSARV